MRNSFWGYLAAFVVFLVLLPGTLFAASDTSASENTIENGMRYVALPFVDAPEEEMDFASPFRGMMLMSRAAISPDISDQQMVATVKLTLAATRAKEFALTDKDIFDTDKGVTIQLLRVDGPQKFTPVQEKVIHSLDEFQFDPVPRFKPGATNPHQASSRIQYLIGLPEAFDLAPAVAIIQKPPMWDPKQYLQVTYEVILRQIINSEVWVKWVDDETVDSRREAFAPLELKVKLMNWNDQEGPIAEFLPQYETEEVGYGREDWFLPVEKGYLDRRSGLDMLYGLDISSHFLSDDGANNGMIAFYVSTKPVEGYGSKDEPGIYDEDHPLLPPQNGLEYMVDLKGDIKNGYTATFRQLKELKFDSGEWGQLKEDQKVQKIGKGLKVELPVPSNVPEGYKFLGWKVQGHEEGQPLTGDYTIDQSQAFEAVYLPPILDVTSDPGKATPEGYIRVTFKAGEGVEIENKIYDVKAGSVLDKDQFPKITVKDGYKNPGWNPAENTAISADQHEFTASAKKEQASEAVLDVTSDPGKATPEGYVRVTFKAGEGVTIEKKVYDVKAGSVLDKDQFPKITVKDGYKNPSWDPAEDTAISADQHEFTASAEKEQASEAVLDVTSDPGKATPEGYVRVIFKAGEGVTIEKKIYDVKAGTVLDKDQFPKITVKDGYKNPGWDPAENTAISADQHEFTASAEKEQDKQNNPGGGTGGHMGGTPGGGGIVLPTPGPDTEKKVLKDNLDQLEQKLNKDQNENTEAYIEGKTVLNEGRQLMERSDAVKKDYEDMNKRVVAAIQGLKEIRFAAYMEGYPDRTFRPDFSITRAEAVALFDRLFALKNDAQQAPYSDVDSSAWYSGAVNRMNALGFLTGYPDGTFKPQGEITRAEFTSLCYRFALQKNMKLNNQRATYFPDVPNDNWAALPIRQCSEAGFIFGYPDGSFGPDKRITRAEAVCIVNRLTGRVADQSFVKDNQERFKQYTDLSPDHWAYTNIMASVINW